MRVLGRSHLGQADDAVLGRRVRRIEACAAQPGDARHVDDAAVVGDGAQLVLEAVEQARQVDINHIIPRLVAQLGQWPCVVADYACFTVEYQLLVRSKASQITS